MPPRARKTPKTPKKSKKSTNSPPAPPAPPPPPPALTDEQILEAHGYNPAGCWIVGPDKNNWVNNSKHLGAYLGFETVEDFREWLRRGGNEALRVEDILKGFHDLYEGNFSKPATKENTRTNISRTAVWDELSSNITGLKSLFTADVKLPPTGVANPGTKVYPIACHLAAMSQLIQVSPKVFTESAALRDAEDEGFRGTGMSCEDLHRAFWVLKFHLRQKSGAKSQKGFYESKEKGPLTPANYFTEEQLKQSRERQTAWPGADQDRATHPVEAYLEEEKDNSIDLNMETDEDDPRLTQQKIQDGEKVVEQLTEIAGQTQHEVDTRRVGRTWERTPLNRDAQRALCREMGSRVKVIHEGKWTPVDPNQGRTQEFLSRAEDLPGNTDPDVQVNDGRSPETKFWKLMNEMTGVCAQMPSFEHACDYLTVDPNDTRFPPDNPSLTLNPWQVVGLYWGIQQECGPVKGGIIADACGIGKTIQMLAIICRRASTRTKSKKISSYRPTLILCPSPVVEVWFTEATKHFPQLRAMRWFESPDKQRTAHIRDATIGTKIDDCLKFLDEQCANDNPRSESTIIISSYDTFQTRAVDIEPTAGRQTEGLWIGDPDEPTGQLIDIKVTYKTRLAGRFQRVVMDEGHKVKNPLTIASHLVGLLQAPIRWFLTATPMLNRAIDFLGYLYLLWNDMMALQAEEDPPGAADRYLQDVTPALTPAYLTGGRYDWEKYRMPLWRLDPFYFRRQLNEKERDLGVYQAYIALKAIIPLIMMRRTQATEMEVRGQTLRIGSQIPIYEVCTVELDFPSDAAYVAYKKTYIKYAKFLQQPYDQSATPSKIPAPKVPSDASIGRNFGFHRRLSLITFNPALEHLLNRVRASQAQHVEKWYGRHKDHGMSMYFDATKPERNLPPYTDRFAFGMYLAKDSPKLLYLGRLIGEICLGQEPRRVMIYADWPISQWMVEGMLKNLGLCIVSLRSSMDAGERAHAIELFNDPGSTVQALVTSLKVSTFGLNLQGCCSDLVVLGVADNVNAMLQVIGRIHRLGQKKQQRVWLVTLARSYDNILQHGQTIKMLQQMAGEANLEMKIQQQLEDDIDADLTGGAHEMGRKIREACQTLIQKLLGQRSSRAPIFWREAVDLEKPLRMIEGGKVSTSDSELSSPPATPRSQTGPSTEKTPPPRNGQGEGSGQGEEKGKEREKEQGKGKGREQSGGRGKGTGGERGGKKRTRSADDADDQARKQPRRSGRNGGKGSKLTATIIRDEPQTWYQ